MNKGVTVWFTGLSGAGKSTIANGLLKILEQRNLSTEILDGDSVRESLCKDLGFSKKDREENIGRIVFVAKLLTKHNVICLVPVISPYKTNRDRAREQITNFIEVYVCASLDKVIERDVKGLYKKALSGEITGFTGIDDPYEEPVNPDLILYTDRCSIDEAIASVYNLLVEKNYVTN